MLSICDKASPKLCHFVIAMKEGSRELPISQASGPLTPPLLGQLVPVMLFELGPNYFSIDTNLYVELNQED